LGVNIKEKLKRKIFISTKSWKGWSKRTKKMEYSKKERQQESSNIDMMNILQVKLVIKTFCAHHLFTSHVIEFKELKT
jgi:hypothetical protein